MARKLQKIEVQCPVCLQAQLEPARVQSTYCRHCGEHYEVVDIPLIDVRAVMRERWEDFKADHLSPPPPEMRWINCHECGHYQKVPRAALSTICPACGRYIRLGDIVVNSVFSRTIRTRENVIVEPTGRLKSSKVVAYNVEIFGLAFSNFECTGEITVRNGGSLGGIIRCSRLQVDRGGNVDRVTRLEARELYIDSFAETRNMRAQRITVGPHGRLDGPINAESFNVEEGGHFQGQLSIAPLNPPLNIPSGVGDRRPPLIRAPHVDTSGLIMNLRRARVVG